MPQVTGVAVSPGRVVGTIRAMAPPVAEPPAGERIPRSSDAVTESERIPVAAASAARALARRAERATGEARTLLEVTAQMAVDPSLIQAAQELVITGRLSAARAVWEAGDQVARVLE